MADQEVKVKITTDASGAVTGFKQVRDEVSKTESQTTTLASKIKTSWLGITAGIAAVAVSLRQAWDMIKAGAEYSEQKGILNNLARDYQTTADAIVSAMADASDHMIANADLMQVAVSGLAKGLSPQQLIDLADAAKMLADTTGGSTTEALRSLTEALETGRLKGIRAYTGSTVDLKEAFGDLESKLTAAERAQAAYALIMIQNEKLQRKQTESVDESADKVERLEAKWKNLMTTLSTGLKTATVSTDDWLGKYIIGPIEAFPSRVKSMGLEKAIFGPKHANAAEGAIVVPEPGAPVKRDKLSEANDILSKIKKDASTRTDDTAVKQTESLVKSWQDVKRSLSDKMELEGLEGLEKKLVENRQEADKLKERFKGLPRALRAEAYAAIDEFKSGMDIRAVEEDAITAMQKDVSEGAKTSTEALNEMMSAAKRVYEETRTPLEQYTEKINQLNKLLQNGVIDQETYGRAAKKALDGMNAATDATKDNFKELTQVIQGWGKESAAAIVDFAMTGKNSFADLIESMIADLLKMIVYQQLIGPLFAGVSSALTGGSFVTGFSNFGKSGSGATPVAGARASGGPVEAGKMYEVNENGMPELLNIGSRQFLMMAEAGGHVTSAAVSAAGAAYGAAGGAPVINVYNNNNSNVSTQTKEGPQGIEIDVIIDQAVAKKLGQNGSYSNRVLKNTYGARERLVSR